MLRLINMCSNTSASYFTPSNKRDVFYLRVYSDLTRHDKFDGYNFADFKSAFTLSASARCARIADTQFVTVIIVDIRNMATTSDWLISLSRFKQRVMIERIPTHATVAEP